ncbi:hypothetical protein STEG23_029788 [Scotinomys teguina]
MRNSSTVKECLGEDLREWITDLNAVFISLEAPLLSPWFWSVERWVRSFSCGLSGPSVWHLDCSVGCGCCVLMTLLVAGTLASGIAYSLCVSIQLHHSHSLGTDGDPGDSHWHLSFEIPPGTTCVDFLLHGRQKQEDYKVTALPGYRMEKKPRTLDKERTQLLQETREFGRQGTHRKKKIEYPERKRLLSAPGVCSSSDEIHLDEDSEAFSLKKQDQLRNWQGFRYVSRVTFKSAVS